MSTSMLYHAFGIRDVKYHKTEFVAGEIWVHAEMTRKLASCPECKSSDTIYQGRKIRPLRLPQIGRHQVWLHLLVHRLQCRNCGALCWPHLPFTGPRLSYTRSFERLVLEILQFATIAACASFLWTGWDLIKDIHRRALQRKYRHIPLKDVRYIAIDEFSIRKGHVYMTIVIDLASGRILHMAQGKGGESIVAFLKNLARRAPNLQAVAMDMSDAYIRAVKKYLPRVAIVLDHYHLAALMNRAVDEFRREFQAECGRLGHKTLKGARFLLLANYENLTRPKQKRLDRLLEINQPIMTMHAMKEQLRLLWEFKSRIEAERFLADWCEDAMSSGIKQLKRMGATIASYRSLILNYFEHPISSGKIEGINNKIKTLKRQAYGYRDMEYFKLRLFHLHEQTYSLTG
jgi:transposase